MKNKLAIFGGKKIRSKLMPKRFAFGKTEQNEINKMITFYKTKNEDPKYSGLWEEKFCSEFSKFMEKGQADAVATGTGAIYIGMKSLELPPKSDVIISPVTCAGALSCITEQGHTPVLVDSKKNSYNTDVEQVEKRLTKNTKLIQITHAAGEPVDIQPIIDLANSKKIPVLEDCSQAIGAKINNKFVGTYGDVAAFSTMYRKNLAANSSSGIVYTTKGDRLFRKILAYGDRGKILWGKNLDLRDPKYALFPALNWNTDEFSCAIGLANLKRLKKTNYKRNKFLKKLIELIKNESVACEPYNYHDGFSPFYFPVFIKKNRLKCTKMEFAKALKAEGIDLGEHYGCLVDTWPWAKKYMKDNFKATNAKNARNRAFHLYLNENYSDQEAFDIIEAIKKVETYFLR